MTINLQLQDVAKPPPAKIELQEEATTRSRMHPKTRKMWATALIIVGIVAMAIDIGLISGFGMAALAAAISVPAAFILAFGITIGGGAAVYYGNKFREKALKDSKEIRKKFHNIVDKVIQKEGIRHQLHLEREKDPVKKSVRDERILKKKAIQAYLETKPSRLELNNLHDASKIFNLPKEED